jgi:P27 family predicted phage terminase small subunit
MRSFIMMRGGKPVPTQLKLLRGNPGQRALPKGEIQPLVEAECPPAPHHIRRSEHAREEWSRIAPELHRLGILTIADYRPLSLYCIAFARWCEAEDALFEMAQENPKHRGLLVDGANGGKITNPLVKIAANASLNVMRFAVEFGFTPASRTRVTGSAAGEEPDRKFAGLIANQ